MCTEDQVYAKALADTVKWFRKRYPDMPSTELYPAACKRVGGSQLALARINLRRAEQRKFANVKVEIDPRKIPVDILSDIIEEGYSQITKK